MRSFGHSSIRMQVPIVPNLVTQRVSSAGFGGFMVVVAVVVVIVVVLVVVERMLMRGVAD